MQFLRVRDGSCLQAASRVAPSFAPHPLYGQTLPTACAVTEVYLFGTLCVATGARVVEVLHVVENLSHPSGRDLCFRMREVPDPRICEIHRHGMAVQSLHVHRIEIPTASCTLLECNVLCRTERLPYTLLPEHAYTGPCGVVRVCGSGSGFTSIQRGGTPRIEVAGLLRRDSLLRSAVYGGSLSATVALSRDKCSIFRMGAPTPSAARRARG